MNYNDFFEMSGMRYNEQYLTDENKRDMDREINRRADNKAMEGFSRIRENLYSSFSRSADHGIISSVYERIDEKDRYIGIRGLNKIADDLIFRIKDAGLEPDEYLLSNVFTMSLFAKPENLVIPLTGKDRISFSSTVNYGGSEGIYFDVFMKYVINDIRGQESIITGKTLDTSVEAFMQMGKVAVFCDLLLQNDWRKIPGLNNYLRRKDNG